MGSFDRLAGIETAPTPQNENGSRFDRLAGLTEGEQLDEMYYSAPGDRQVSDEERNATMSALVRRMEDESKLATMRYAAALKAVKEAEVAMKGAKSGEGQDYHSKANKSLANAAAALGSALRCARSCQDQIYDAMPMVRG